jgi:hypothetical protein
VDAACTLFRDEWLASGAPGGDADHASRCAECAAWLRARTRQRRALELLAPQRAPEELGARVAAELAGERTRRVERVLSSLARLGAPAELDGRVSALLRATSSAEERGRESAEVLRSMDVLEAPPVLERLLDEELADPARQRAERFPGSLERLHAPAELERRLQRSARRSTAVRLVVAPLLALSAAGLVVWLAVTGPAPEAREYRFEVVHATSLEGLDPLARRLAGSLGGADPR